MRGVPQQFLLAALLCFAGDSVAADEFPFEIELAVGRINGSGIGTDSPDLKRVEHVHQQSSRIPDSAGAYSPVSKPLAWTSSGRGPHDAAPVTMRTADSA